MTANNKCNLGIGHLNPANSERTDLMIEMARLYYKENLTQAEISKLFNFSTATVSRILKEALQSKWVEVTIHNPIITVPDLEKALVEHFGLKSAHVLADRTYEYKNLVKSVGQLAARVLKTYLYDGITLAISLGQAVAETVEALTITDPIRVRIALTHGQSDIDLIEGSKVVRVLAQKLGNDVRIIPSPLMLKNELICKVVKQEHTVKEVLAIAEHADIALVGIGAPIPEISALLLNKYVHEKDLGKLSEEGAIGDVCAVQFDAQGRVLDIGINRRLITIDINHLHNIPTVIGVSAGIQKASAILGALRGHYVNVLVTDANVADFLLNNDLY